MLDPRVKLLAQKLVGYSCKVQPGENVLIESTGAAKEFIVELIRAVSQAGGKPYMWLHEQQSMRALVASSTDEQLKLMAEFDTAFMKRMQCYIGVRGGFNQYENSDVPAETHERYDVLYREPVHTRTRVPQTKWVILRWPTPSMAQSAKMSTEAFEDMFFDVCTLDYEKMSVAMNPLVELMQKTDRVHIKGPGTDLRFSIKGIPAVKCDGDRNIPDGEVYTAPVKDSVEGVITYNTPSPMNGFTYENVHLEFSKGKIIKATANDTERINKVFNTDEGARYVGEFSFGLNPYITKPMQDILFDEKISGSFHFTPGSSYDEAFNGNKSAVHWDLVLIQTPEWGGGEIYFDDVIIRKDGRFVHEALLGLNPEELKK